MSLAVSLGFGLSFGVFSGCGLGPIVVVDDEDPLCTISRCLPWSNDSLGRPGATPVMELDEMGGNDRSFFHLLIILAASPSGT